MLGTGEPHLTPIDPRLLEATAGILDSVGVDRQREDVVALAEPRGRLHAPEAMARADAFLLDGFRAA
ncbi:MAG: hypothetical protein AB7U18_28190, partial [Dehalococcoidia bacterium]